MPGTVLSTGVSQSNDANMFNVLEEFKELTGEGGSFIKQMIQLIFNYRFSSPLKNTGVCVCVCVCLRD